MTLMKQMLTVILTVIEATQDGTWRTMKFVDPRRIALNKGIEYLDDPWRTTEERIVAPKVAGSSPVGHPPESRMTKPGTRKRTRACLVNRLVLRYLPIQRSRLGEGV